ncbi:TolC family protein [Roseivirga sp. BDSF3-8]|uniref:TolC family protein n=1 Tax=Roseivirga sp. BDSF3-8 TaxID=3241598 RepID=UPI003531DD17
MRSLFFFLIIYTMTVSGLRAQAPADTLETLAYEEYLQRVLAYHPVVSQADLLTDQAEARLLQARGNFDPKVTSDYLFKQYQGTEYYDNWYSTLKIPLYVPVDLKVAYERNQGTYVNPENNVPDEGLWSVGVSVSVLQGLITDERRTTLRQARLYTEMARAEQQKAVSKALLNAAKDYWNWYYAYNQYILLIENEELAAFRFEAVRQQVLNGDKAAIDSVEAKIALQTRNISTRQAAVDLLNAILQLNLNLWGESREPIYLSQQAIPQIVGPSGLEADILSQLLESAMDNHPELVKVRLKGSALELDKRLYRNQLLPEANLEYNLLSNSDHEFEGGEEPLFFNNYKLGASVSWPIFMRKSRGKLAETQVKIDQNILERSYTSRDVINEITMGYNSLLTLDELILLQEEAVDNYEIMVRGENIKFQNGESSLFLVNSRENKLIEARLKLLKIRADKEKALAELYAATGDPSIWLDENDD